MNLIDSLLFSIPFFFFLRKKTNIFVLFSRDKSRISSKKNFILLKV